MGVTATLVLGSVIAAAPANAAIATACTVTVTPPATISVSTYEQIFYVDIAKTENGQTPDCIDDMTLSLVRKSDNRELDWWRISSSDLDYQNGRVELDVPPFPDFAIAGTYALRVDDASLSYSWAEANGYSPWNDRPEIQIAKNSIDLRFAAKASLKLSRTLDGVSVTGKVFRADAQCCGDSYVPQSGSRVAIQKQNGKTWVTKKTVTSNSKGAYSALLKDDAKGTWRAQVQAAPTHWSKTSSSATIAKKAVGKAATKATISTEPVYSYFSIVGTKFKTTVRVNPGAGFITAPSGTVVKVQKRAKKGWQTVKTVKTNSKGATSFTTKTKGTYRFVVPETKRTKRTVSAARSW